MTLPRDVRWAVPQPGGLVVASVPGCDETWPPLPSPRRVRGQPAPAHVRRAPDGADGRAGQVPGAQQERTFQTQLLQVPSSPVPSCPLPALCSCPAWGMPVGAEGTGFNPAQTRRGFPGLSAQTAGRGWCSWSGDRSAWQDRSPLCVAAAVTQTWQMPAQFHRARWQLYF